MMGLTPLIPSNSVKDVALGPQSWAHFVTSQSISELNGEYGFSVGPPQIILVFLHCGYTL